MLYSGNWADGAHTFSGNILCVWGVRKIGHIMTNSIIQLCSTQRKALIASATLNGSHAKSDPVQLVQQAMSMVQLWSELQWATKLRAFRRQSNEDSACSMQKGLWAPRWRQISF